MPVGSMLMESKDRDRDRELLLPAVSDAALSGSSSPSTPPPPRPPHTPSSSHLHPSAIVNTEAFSKVLRSWSSKKFMTGCVILLPIAITFYITWWFIHFVDGFFSPIFTHLGINFFGLGLITSITFIFLLGVFMSSWLGASLLGLGEWFIKKMPLVSHIYSALKQISIAITPDQSAKAFKEVVILRHPRIGEYAIGFITSTVILRTFTAEEKLTCVYIPTNNIYLGDIFLINSKDIIGSSLSVREGIEIVISGGISIPQILSTVDANAIFAEHGRVGKSPRYATL